MPGVTGTRGLWPGKDFACEGWPAAGNFIRPKYILLESPAAGNEGGGGDMRRVAGSGSNSWRRRVAGPRGGAPRWQGLAATAGDGEARRGVIPSDRVYRQQLEMGGRGRAQVAGSTTHWMTGARSSLLLVPPSLISARLGACTSTPCGRPLTPTGPLSTKSNRRPSLLFLPWYRPPYQIRLVERLHLNAVPPPPSSSSILECPSPLPAPPPT